jgi:uncharacterized protein YjbI with pentapeptide repeats
MIDYFKLIEEINSSRRINFTDLVEISGLNPSQDFCGVDLRGCNFRNQDLRNFNFTNSLLYGAEIRGARFSDESIAGAYFFEFEKDFGERAKFAGRKFVASARFHEREINFVPLLVVGRVDEIQSYIDIQKPRERSSRVLDAINVAEFALREETNLRAAIEVSGLISKHISSGFPLAKYKYKEELMRTHKLFGEVRNILPSR